MAIVYSYPKVTSPLATDVLVLTDTTVTAGKRKNKTKSIAMSDVATYVIDSKSGITGTGTINKFPIFTAATVIGDSIITQAALGQGITVGGNLDVTNDTNLQGSLLADSLEVTNDSVFTGSARFNSTIKDTSGGVGTNGQVLTSTGTGVAWTTDAGGSVTGTGTTNYIAKWNTSSSIQDSIIFDNGTNVGIGTNSPNFLLDVEAQGADMRVFNLTSDANTDVYIRTTGTAASSRILFGDSADPDVGNIIYRHNSNSLAFATNNSEKMRITSDGNTGIGTTTPQAKLHVNGQTAFLVTDGNETGLEINNGSYIYKIGDISGGENQAYMQIDSAASKAFFLNSNVGIGTTSPSQKLHVEGNVLINGAAPYVSIKTTQTGTPDWKIYNSYNSVGDFAIVGGSSGGNKFNIQPNGNVGIGTTSPGVKLDVDGQIRSDDSFLLQSGTTAIGSIRNQNGALDIRGDSTRDVSLGSVTSPQALFVEGTNGNVGIGTTSPISIGGHSGILTLYGSNATALTLKDAVSEGHLRFDDSNFKFTNSGGNVRMQIEADTGNVGIGTTSPQQKLHVFGGAAGIEIDSSTNEASLHFDNSTTTSSIKLANNDLKTELGGSERMRILANGNVGIGTTSPTRALDVSKSGSTILANFKNTGGTSSFISLGNTSSTADQIRLGSNGTALTLSTNYAEKMRIDSTGNVGIGTTSPTDKLHVNGDVRVDGNDGVATKKVRSSYFSSTQNLDLVAGSSADIILTSDKVGIGTTNPASKLTVTGGDAEVTGSDKGLILESPNGTRYRIKVDNSGNLTTTAV